MSAVPPPPPDDNNGGGSGGAPDELEMAVQVLTRDLGTELLTIKNERAFLAAERKRLDDLNRRLNAFDPSEHDRLKLNVGGSRFEVRAACIKKNIFFRSLLSGTFASCDSDGFYFVDRDPIHIAAILHFLREGVLDLDHYSDRQLDRLKTEAEFYMVQDLHATIEELRSKKRSKQGVQVVGVNRHVPASSFAFFNGIVFEFQVTAVHELQLHSVSFVGGEKRKIVGEVYLKLGPMDAPGRFEKIGDVDALVDRLSVVNVAFAAVSLTSSSYTLAIYSASCPTAIAVCPKDLSNRDLLGDNNAGIIRMTRSYHTVDPRGQFSKRAGPEDTFDFVGEMTFSSR